MSDVLKIKLKELKVISRSLEVVSMSFEFFKCFISLQAIWWPNFIKVLGMNSKDTESLDNLGQLGPIVKGLV